MLLSFTAGILFGSTTLTPAEIWTALGSGDNSPAHIIVNELRLPRVINAFVIGGLLAVAGTLVQVLIRNPLGDPYVLGISGGAAFGALISLSLQLPWTTPGAIAGAVLSVLLLVLMTRGSDADNPVRLLLSGIVMAAGWGALITLVLSLSDSQQLQGMVFWLMGDIRDTAPDYRALLILLVISSFALLLARDLDLYVQGETLARSLGVDTGRLHWIIFGLSSILTATAVTLAGPVGFVGLIVPHLIRLTGNAKHGVLLPAALMLGGTLLVAADTTARSIIAPIQIPVGVMLALIGVPLFLFLLNRTSIRAN